MKNLKQFTKTLNKKGFITEFVTPTSWLSTGNHALNFRMTGSFSHGIPNKRMVVYWGPKSSGKSYLLSLAALQAQQSGYHVIYIDTEHAAEKNFMDKVGLDTSSDKFTPIPISSIEQATEVMSEIFQNTEENDKIFIAFDSLSMMLSEKEMTDFKRGDMKGDQGQIAKKLKLFMKNINSKIAKFDMFFVATGHAYLNQNLLNGKGAYIFSGGEGVEFIPSIAVFVNRLKLKQDDLMIGIRVNVEITKTRFSQSFTKLQLELPYKTGLDPLNGLLDIAKEASLVKQSGAWFSYIFKGTEYKFQKKNFKDHYDKLFKIDNGKKPIDNV